MKYRAIMDHADRFSIRLMCRALKVSPAGYYAWVTRPKNPCASANRALLVEIRTIHAQSRRTYGSPRVWDTLKTMWPWCRREPRGALDAREWHSGENSEAM